MARAAALRAVAPDDCGSLAAFLFELGVRGVPHGLSPCSEPALLAGAVPEELWDRTPLQEDDLARLIRRAYGRRWVGFWLLARLASERELSPATVGAGLRAWMTKEPGRVDEKALATLHPPLSEDEPQGGVDVVIPTLGRPGPLRDTLEDLSAQTFLPRRVIVIAQDSTPKPTGEWPFDLVFLSLPTPGACKARNAGLREVRSEWVLFLDDDVRLQSGLLSHMVRTAQAYGVEAVNALVYLPGQDPQRVSGSPLPRPWPIFGTAAALVSAAAVEAAGGLDEQLEGGYGEDYDLGVCLRLAGAAVLYAPGKPVLHLQAPAGGFREPFRHPWSDDPVPPRPSPTVLYSRRKHHISSMQEGYRVYYALKRLSGKPLHTWPRELRSIARHWERAVFWAGRMLKATHPPG
jgi:glycosyltransferase involved in cell wall biosynthesis